MTLSDVKNKIPDYGRDIRLNLETVLTPDGSPGLTPPQMWGVALSCAYALEAQSLVEAVFDEAKGLIEDGAVLAAKSAAVIMAMNNVYYRSTHLIKDEELRKLPVRLRMSVIGKPGVPKTDFELMCFAVSALAGCGQCMTAHLNEILKAGVSHEGAQSALRIASVLNAADRALKIADLGS